MIVLITVLNVFTVWLAYRPEYERMISSFTLLEIPVHLFLSGTVTMWMAGRW